MPACCSTVASGWPASCVGWQKPVVSLVGFVILLVALYFAFIRS
jgi:hypothetical protein